ncbi:MAG: hypothetical protein IPF77_16815 [Gemmatimonadetes bacterium]|nr:hypothetical protein [Gemmatimonadota bacterium]
MPDAPLIPPACVAAVLRVGPCVLNRSETGRAAWAEKIARAVLDAFVAGEGGAGAYHCFDGGCDGWYVNGVKPGALDRWTEPQARACAAVLNYLEAKGE